MIEPKLQNVFVSVPETSYDYTVNFSTGEFLDTVDIVELYTFTQEEFDTFKREFGKELLEKAANNAETKKDYWDPFLDPRIIVDKKSITSVLDDFLNKK